MLDTVQVRNIMRKHGVLVSGIYVNKLADSKFRSVKCYVDECDSENLIKTLTSLGAEFKVTSGANWSRSRGPGIVVKCAAGRMCG